MWARGSESGALQREAGGVLRAAVMGVSVNSGAVGGGFRSAFDPAAGATETAATCVVSPVHAPQPAPSI